MDKLAGIILSVIIAVVAVVISQFLPIGSVALAIIVAAIFANIVSIPKKFDAGITFSEKTLLAWAIALMGINLNFSVLESLGFSTIFIIIIALVATILFAVLLGKLLNFEKHFALMLGIGNGICGSAAIAATKNIIGLNQQNTALSVAIVNFLGTVGIFVLPAIGAMLSFSDVQIGVLIGNTLQAVGHVVASGFAVNETVGQSSTIVKMGRVLLLTPVLFVLIYVMFKNKANTHASSNIFSQIPLFIVGFVVFSIVATLQILPENIEHLIAQTSKYLLLLAMSAIGLKISFKHIKEHGGKALTIGTYIFIFQIVFSSVLIMVLL